MEQYQHLFELWKNGNKKQVFNSIASMTGLEAGLAAAYIHDQEIKSTTHPCFIKDLETMYLASEIMNSGDAARIEKSTNICVEQPISLSVNHIVQTEKSSKIKVKPVQKSISVNNCMECPHHEVIADGDPHDSFCSDDKAVVCQLVTNNKRNLKSLHNSDRSEFKAITRAARPYNLRKECSVPDWCPMPTLIVE